jgi:chromosome segregation ATPase
MLSFAERIIMKKDRAKKVLIRLTEEEKNKLQEMAEENEMKVEPFVRRTIFSNDIKKLSNENDALREEIKDLKQDIRILTNQNLADKEVLSKFTSQLLEMLEKLDKMKQEKEILSLELSEMKEKKPFWRRIFGR